MSQFRNSRQGGTYFYWIKRRWSTLCKYPEKTVALASSLEMTFEPAGEMYYHESCNKNYTDDVKLKRAKIAMVSILNRFNTTNPTNKLSS